MTSPNFWYLFAGYGAFWFLMAAFLMYIGGRHRALERELRALEERLPRSPGA